MKRKNKNIAIFIILLIGASIFIINSNVFSVFNPSSEKFTQYALNHDDDLLFISMMKGTNIGQPSSAYGNHNSLAYTSLSKESTIDTGKNQFKFVSSFFWGINPSYHNGMGCYQTTKVYKNNQEIQTIVHYTITNGAKNWENKEYKFYDDSLQESYASFKTSFQDSRYYTWNGAIDECGFAINNYYVKLSDTSFEVNATTPTTTFIEGTPVDVNIEINNKLTTQHLADVELKFVAPTLFGNAEKIITQQGVILNPGKNNIKLTLVPESSTGKLEIYTKLSIKSRGTSFSGTNYGNSLTQYTTENICSGVGASHCCAPSSYGIACLWESSSKKDSSIQEWIEIGIIELDKQLISVSPKPLYLSFEGDACPNGYEISNNGEYCVRNDISSLGCAILGCPFIEGHEYSCTSSGICAETVFVDKKCTNNQECPTNTTCDVPSGLCIKTEIFNEFIQKECTQDNDCPDNYECNTNNGLCFNITYIPTSCIANLQCPSTYECDSSTGFCFKETTITLQCTENSDCPIPCDGVSAQCNVVGQCIYSGQCNPVEVGCIQYGCPDNYVCDNSRNVCLEERDENRIATSLIIGGIILTVFLIWLYRRSKR